MASVTASIELRYTPVAFATCGITFGPTRCHEETFARMPLRSPSSPRYVPHGQLMITTSTGLSRAATPSSPAVERERPEVARREPVRADHVHADLAQRVGRVRQLHVEELRRVDETLE